MEDLVKVEVKDGVGELILNRPQQRNSLTGPLVWSLQEGLDSLLKNDECRVIIIRGEKGYFCAGLDLKSFTQDPPPDWKAGFQKDWTNFHKTVFYSNKAIIGAIEGFAIAGGTALALACDFLVIGKSSFFHVLEVERGMLAPMNIFWLSQRYSYRMSLKLALLGERISGPALVDLGVADYCVNDDGVLLKSREMALRLANFDPKNTQNLKSSIRSARQFADFDELLAAVSP